MIDLVTKSNQPTGPEARRKFPWSTIVEAREREPVRSIAKKPGHKRRVLPQRMPRRDPANRRLRADSPTRPEQVHWRPQRNDQGCRWPHMAKENTPQAIHRCHPVRTNSEPEDSVRPPEGADSSAWSTLRPECVALPPADQREVQDAGLVRTGEWESYENSEKKRFICITAAYEPGHITWRDKSRNRMLTSHQRRN
jgi:hypothetical protein